MRRPVAKVVDCKWGEYEYKALAFLCPGCNNDMHLLPISGTGKVPNGRPSWDFDGNIESPTLSPSILTQVGSQFICHSFMRNGYFEYLSDCTHQYAGQTIPMIPLPQRWLDAHKE